mgnify:CR=1 FL=1
MYSELEKKQFMIFVIVAYGITYVLGLVMWYGNTAGIDLSAFPNAQMLYPAAGVMLAFLLTKKEDVRMPKGFYRCFLLITAAAIVIAVLSVVSPNTTVEMQGGTVSIWILLVQLVLIGGSVLCWIFILSAGKKRREAYGLRWKNWKISLLCILLFLLLYSARTAAAYILAGQGSAIFDIFVSPLTWRYLSMMPINFFLSFVAFFGEEYGWRYYLQPFLQKKFGLRRGVLVLGVVWGFWHLPVDFFYYVTPDMGVIMTVSQIITCVCLGIFFAYAYMKTGNIWVPVAIHFLNNNLAPVITGTYSADVLQNQSVSWRDLPSALLINGICFGLFLLAKPFRKSKENI